VNFALKKEATIVELFWRFFRCERTLFSSSSFDLGEGVDIPTKHFQKVLEKQREI